MSAMLCVVCYQKEKKRKGWPTNSDTVGSGYIWHESSLNMGGKEKFRIVSLNKTSPAFFSTQAGSRAIGLARLARTSSLASIVHL